jgi:hypothetical protein
MALRWLKLSLPVGGLHLRQRTEGFPWCKGNTKSEPGVNYRARCELLRNELLAAD